MDPLDFDRVCPIFSFPTLPLSLSPSLLPLWYLCIGSCRGDKTHKHCGSRQEVLWNHNGVTAALCLLSSLPLSLSLSLSAPASMHAIILSKLNRDHTALSLSLSSLSFLSLLLALLFQLSPSLLLSSTVHHISCFSIWKITV